MGVTLVMDGKQTAIANDDVTLNPNNELEGPAEGDPDMTVEEGLDESADRDVSEIESNVGNEVAVEGRVDNFELAGLQEGQEMEAEEQGTKVEKGLSETADRDVSEIESNVGNEIAVEGRVDNFELVGLQEGQEMEAEEQDMKVEQGLNESADRDVSEIQSNVGNEIAVEGHMNNFELVGLQEGQEMEAEEQDTKVEKVLNESADRDVSEIQSNVGNEIAVEGRVDNFELVGLREGQEMEAEEQDTKVKKGLNDRVDHDVSKMESNVGNEIAAEVCVDNLELVGLQEGQPMEAEEVEEGLNESADCNISEIESNVGNEIAAEGHVDNFEPVGLQEGQSVEAEEQGMKVEEGLNESADCDVSEIESNVGNEIAAEGCVDNFELVGSKAAQSVEAEEKDMKVEEGLNASADCDVFKIDSNVGNEIAAEGRVDNFKPVGLQEGQSVEAEEQAMKVEEGLDESADCDVSEIESNVGNKIAAEGRVDNFEPVGLQEGQLVEAEEQGMKVEEGLNESADRDVSGIASNVGNEIAVEGCVDNFKPVGLQEGQEMQAEEQDMKVEEGLNESADRDVSEIESNVGNEIAAAGRVDNFELVGLEEGQSVEAEEQDMKIEEGLNESPDRDVSEIESNVGNEIAADGCVDNFEPVGLLEGQSVEAEEQGLKVQEGLNESADRDVPEIESNVGNEIAVEGRVDSFELVGLQEGQDMKAEERDIKVEEGLNESADCDFSVIDSNVGNDIAVEGRVDNFKPVGSQEGQEMEDEEQDMKAEEGLNESADHDVSEIESNVGNEIAVEGRVDYFELVDLQEGQEMEAEEQDMKVEEGSNESAGRDVSETESNVENEIAVEGRVDNFELVGLQEGREMEAEGQDMKVKEAVNESADRDVSEIESNVGNEIPVEGHVDNFELAGLQEGQGIEAEEQDMKVEEGLNESADLDVSEIESNVRNEMAVEGHIDNFELVGLQEGQEMEAEEQDTNFKQPKIAEEKSAKQATLNPGSTVKAHQASYQLPLDDEGEFTVSDLVWGKVRSHPWWPGQIFDPSYASEKAMKYHKKDCFLVAYFGDRTFAWNEASLLKPFRSHFSEAKKQSNSETFQNAVNCALEEVSRRVEFGLACSCISEDIYDNIKIQMVENTGIQKESIVRASVDKSMLAHLFEPGKLVEYMKALALSPAGGADQLELVIAKSQLLAFYRLKGYFQLPKFQFCGGLLENIETSHFDDEVIVQKSPVSEDDGQISPGQETLPTQRSSYYKRKHNLKDTIYPRKKEKCMSELMGDSWDSVDDEIDLDGKANNKFVSPSSGKKQKSSDSLAKISMTAPHLAKPSFKIGECIQRVASQMTGSPSILKANNQKQDGSNDGLAGGEFDGSFHHSEDAEMRRMIVPTEYSSLYELLSQLHLAAQDPLKGYSFLTIIISFFSDFRNSVIMEQHDKVGGKRRHSIGGSPKTFEFEDMSDTYWRDRVIQNGSEEQPTRQSRKLDNLFVPVDLDKSVSKSNSRKRYSDGNYGQSTKKPAGYVDEKAPAELIMHFPVVDSVPSETSLSKMFRHFGPLKESETEVDRFTNRARVVFKKCSDAEAAYDSALKFNIFGSILVNYQLNYTITMPFKTEPVAIFQEEDAALFLQY